MSVYSVPLKGARQIIERGYKLGGIAIGRTTGRRDVGIMEPDGTRGSCLARSGNARRVRGGSRPGTPNSTVVDNINFSLRAKGAGRRAKRGEPDQDPLS